MNTNIYHNRAIKAWVTKRKNGTDTVWNKGKIGFQVAWNKGLTKETDYRVDKISKKLIGNKICLGRKLSIITKDKIREKAISQWSNKEKRKNTIDGIKKAILSGKYTPQNNAFKGLGFREDLKQFFRSRWEANFARYLKENKIEYEYENHRFDLGESVYIPDFYIKNLNTYIEVQGYVREKKEIKLKRFRELYPDIKLNILDSTGYRLLEKNYGKIINNWEFSHSKKEVILRENR